MASANLNIAVKKEWMLAQPWPWLGAGFALTLWSWLWTFSFGESASDYRVIVLAAGLLATGAGLWLRWRDRQSIYLQTGRLPLVFALGCLFGLLGLGVIVVFLGTIIIPDRIGFKTAALFLVVISVGPTSYYAARHCFQRDVGDQSSRDVDEEIALSFVAGAGICVLGSFTLYADRRNPADWDTLRMFLRVAAAVCLFASALALVSKAVRRIMLSVLITIHFLGISTAVLSASPAPWIVTQTWMRVFRPYLEFVYLNNAYHFYAPEPGPASYLWFRIIYETPDKREFGEWYKVPDLDDEGRIKHRVALEYQRLLSLTEAIAHPGPLPSESYFDQEKKRWDLRPIYKDRLSLLQAPIKDDAAEEKAKKDGNNAPGANVVVGALPVKAKWIIPLDPEYTPMQQVTIPNPTSRQLLESYARFVAEKFKVCRDADKADAKFKSVKVYRVVHRIPPIHWFHNQFSPTDPSLYLPFYLGNYSADGKMIEDQDPYRFWLLPSLREFPNDPDSKIFDFARLHAGDERWVRPTGSVLWREAHPKERELVLPKE